MGDGPQTLLDVIDDSHVLDKFFETFPSATLDDSPRFDNVTAGSENNLLPNGIDLNFDTLSEPPRGTSNYVSHLPTSSHFLHPPNFGHNAMANSTANSQLFAHALHPVHLSSHNSVTSQPSHHHLQSSLPVSDGSDNLPRHEQDPLHHLLANGSSLSGHHQTQSSMQLHHSYHSVAHQENIQSALHLGTPGSMLHTSHSLGRPHAGKTGAVSSSDTDLSSVLMPTNISCITSSNFANQTSVAQVTASSLNSLQILQRAPNASVANNAHISRAVQGPKTLNSPIRAANSAKDSLVNTQSQLNSIALTGAQQIVSGSTLGAQSGHIISNPSSFANAGMLQPGQVFQSSSLISGTSVLASPISSNVPIVSLHENSISANSGIHSVSQTTSGTYNPQVVLSSSSSVVSTVSITPSSAATTCKTSYTNSNKSPITSTCKVSPGRQGHTSSKSGPSNGRNHSTKSSAASPHQRNIKSPVASQTMSPAHSIAGTPQTNLASLVPGLGVVQGLVTPLSGGGIPGTNGVVGAPTNALQVSSNVKQMMSGGQLIQIVSSQQSNPSRHPTIHSLPKPIQPKQPQLLPKPCQGVVRQPTPPPPGKTLIGSRPQSVSSQQPLLLSGGTQPSTVIGGQPNLGPFFLNPSILQSGLQQQVLLTQNGMQFLLRPPAPQNNPGQAIIVPIPGQSQVLPSVGKVGTSQAINACAPQGLTTYVINPAMGSSLSNNTMFATSQGATRTNTPILRLVAPQAAPLQLQQIQSPSGPTFIALPNQSSFNLPGMFASASGAVRTINPQVAPGTLQLASPLAQVPTMSNIQLPAGLASIPGQNVQLNPTSLSTSVATTGPSLAPSSSQQHILVKCSQPSNSKKEERVLINVSSPSPVEQKTSKKKKSSKKKKETEEEKKDDKVVSINLNELLKQNGIGDGMIFEENEFESLNVENIDASLITEAKPVQTTTQLPIVSSVGTETQSQIMPPPLLTATSGAAPSLGQVCLAMDANGKLVVCQQDFSKNLPGTSGLQLAPPVIPTNQTLLNATSTGSFIITNPTTGFSANNISQFVAIPSVSNSIPSSVTKTFSAKSTEAARIPIPSAQDVMSSGVHNSNNPITKSSESSSKIQVSIPVSNRNSSSDASETHQFSIPQTFVEQKCKKLKKKPSKEKKSPYSTQPLLLPNNQKVETPLNKQTFPEKVQGDSMPTFSFGILSPDGKSPTTSSNGKPIANLYLGNSKSRGSAISSPVQKTSSGTEWAQPPVQELQKVYLSQKNSDLFQSLQMQINKIESQSTLDVKDQMTLQRLKGEQKNIIVKNSESKSNSRMAQRLPTTNNSTISLRAGIKYSHSVGHKKILLSPNQKKSPNSAPIKESQIEQGNTIQGLAETSGSVGSVQSVSTPLATSMCAPSMPSLSPKSLESSRNKGKISSSSSLTSSSQSIVVNGSIASNTYLSSTLSVSELPEGNRPATTLCSPLTPAKNMHTNSTMPSVGIPLTRDQLFEHQLTTDQNGASRPDYITPFKGKVDACKRLVRYHVFYEKDEPAEVVEQCEKTFSDYSEVLIRKKNLLESKFQSLLVKDSMRPYATAEDALIHKLVLNEEKMNFEREKAEIMKGKELKFQSHPSEWKVGPCTLDDPLATYEWEDGKVFQKDPDSGALVNLTEVLPEKEETKPQASHHPFDSDEEFQDEPRLTILEDEVAEDLEQNREEELPSATPTLPCPRQMDTLCVSPKLDKERQIHAQSTAKEIPCLKSLSDKNNSTAEDERCSEQNDVNSFSRREDRKSREYSKKKRHKRKNRDHESSERKSSKRQRVEIKDHLNSIEEHASGGLKLKLKKQLGSGDYYSVGDDHRRRDRRPTEHLYPSSHFMNAGEGGFRYGSPAFCHYQGYSLNPNNCPPPNPPAPQQPYPSLGLPPNSYKWGT